MVFCATSIFALLLFGPGRDGSSSSGDYVMWMVGRVYWAMYRIYASTFICHHLIQFSYYYPASKSFFDHHTTACISTLWRYYLHIWSDPSRFSFLYKSSCHGNMLQNREKRKVQILHETFVRIWNQFTIEKEWQKNSPMALRNSKSARAGTFQPKCRSRWSQFLFIILRLFKLVLRPVSNLPMFYSLHSFSWFFQILYIGYIWLLNKL